METVGDTLRASTSSKDVRHLMAPASRMFMKADEDGTGL